jgi:uncharacterized protein YraI
MKGLDEMKKQMVIGVLCACFLFGGIQKTMQPMVVHAESTQEYTVLASSGTGYATTALNVRTGPSTAYAAIGSFMPSQAVNITGECSNGWLQVEYNGQIAFASGKYISRQQPTEALVSTNQTAVAGIAESKAGAGQDWVNKANQRLALVPENIKASFVNNGWHLYVTGENIAQTYFGGAYSSVRGATSTDGKFIVVETRSEAVKTAPIHELGHYLDCTTGWPSTTAEFTDIYNAEIGTFKSQITNAGAVRNQQEFFAEIFYYVVTDGSKCTPRAKEFVQRYINSL